jgi:hypothetical protein
LNCAQRRNVSTADSVGVVATRDYFQKGFGKMNACICRGLALAGVVLAGAAASAQATITYVESRPLEIQERFRVGEQVNVTLPEGYRLVVNEKPVVAESGTVHYTFRDPGDYVVVTQRRSGDTWVPVSTATTSVISETSTTTDSTGSTTTTTTTTTAPDGSQKMEKTTTTSTPAGRASVTETTTTGTPTTVISSPAGTAVTFYEERPLALRERYVVGEPLRIQVPDTVKTEYRWRIGDQTIVYDDSRIAAYTFAQPGEIEIVTEKRVGSTWTPVHSSHTVVVEK